MMSRAASAWSCSAIYSAQRTRQVRVPPALSAVHVSRRSPACAEPGFVTDMEEDIREECAKLGEVQKVTVFPNHPAGVVSVKFKRPGAATLCIERMNGRWFSQRQVACEFWDGKTDYSKYECPPPANSRLVE